MRLLEKVERIRQRELMIDEFREPVSFVKMKETGETKPYTLDANEEWHLVAQIGVRFWANRAQLEDAAKIAERTLVMRLYEDIACELPELRSAIMNGDRKAAMKVCDRIDSWLR